MRNYKLISIYTAILLGISENSGAASFNLSDWTTVQYDVPQNNPNGVWVQSNDNTVVTQTQNAEASIFLSDFTIIHSTHPGIFGNWRVNTTADDDVFGIVFGYQGRGQYYLFDWKKADQGLADGGMHLRTINVPGGADPTVQDLAGDTDTANMQILMQNDFAWTPSTDYGFDLTYSTDGFELLIAEDNTVLADWIISDSTYTSGQFGFFNHSQPQVAYTAGQLPIPPAVWLLGSGLIALIGVAGKRKAA